MGVPKFFAWLSKKYKLDTFIENNNTYNIDSLLIDTNCLLHPQCFKILNENIDKENINFKDLERKMINQCIIYLEYIIHFVKPKKEIYIAIDGVAPAAKIKQQRQRRFKSVNDRILFDNLRKKYNKKKELYWNNAAISPGTIFMKNLNEKIKEFCKNKKNIKIYFSSSNVPEEGEHKLLQFIKKSNNNFNYVIYGLDADLIFLSLACKKNNILLLRESNEIGLNEENILKYVNIDKLKECVIQEIKLELMNNKNDTEIINKSLELNNDNLIQDFVFICYFIGNDFLPKIPSIDIIFNEKIFNGIELLINSYCLGLIKLNEYFVLENNNYYYFNENFLQIFFDNLKLYEDDYLNYLGNKKNFVKKSTINDSFENEKYKIENLLFKIEDKIQFNKNGYKYRYYNYYFNIEYNYISEIKNICLEYLKGLIWNLNYYFNECISWDWYYYYDYSPFISDLSDNLKRININEIKFNKGKPLNKLVQLFCILPPQSSNLIPKNLQYLLNDINSDLIHLYPIKINQDFLYKYKYYKAIPKLPLLDIELVKKTLLNKINDNEKNDILIYNEEIF